MPEYDVVIKDGMVFDGARNPRFKSDIGIKDGIIRAMGHLRSSDGRQVIDASGLNVAPGFIDLHTHYDGQLFWDPYCSMSSWHGSTSVVIGNCGFGFAPVAEDMRERSMLAMTRNEAIPLKSLEMGMPWDWETFPQFLDSVERTPKSVNILPYVGLSPLLIWVMGMERAKAGAVPTDAEHAEMKRLLHEAMDAGACGWSVQRWSPNNGNTQRDFDGTPMATDLMHDATTLELAGVLGERNEGFMQMTLRNSADPRVDWKHCEELVRISRRPLIWNVLAVRSSRDPALASAHRDTMTWLRGCVERGLRIYGQAHTTETPMFFTLEDWNIYDDSDAWREATLGTVEERLAKLKDPVRREAMRRNPTAGGASGPLEELVIIHGFTDETKAYEDLKIRDVMALTGKDVIDAMLDVACADGLKTLFYGEPFSGPRGYQKEIVDFEWGIPGTSDGGAHTKFLTSARYTTEFLTKWVRDMGWMSLEEAHWKLSAYPAFCAGFRNRGVLREGAPADIVCYDYRQLETLPQEVVHDLPGNEWRRVQRARGYRHILVNGEMTIEDDKETGVPSGQLLRHGGTIS